MKNFIKVTIIASLLIVSSFVYNGRELSAQTLGGLYAELDKLQGQVSATESNIASTKNNIETHKQAIITATADIEKKQVEISDNQTEIYDLEEEKKAKHSEIQDLLVYYQMHNIANDEISFVVSADSLTSTIHREYTVDALTSKNDSKIGEFIQIQDQLTEKNATLETDIKSLETMQVEFEKKIEAYKIELDDLSEYSVGAKEKVADMQNTIAYYKNLGCTTDEDLERCKERTNNVVPNSSGFVSPMNSGVVTSEFGWRWGALHAGLDLSGSDTAVLAAAPGTVGAVGYDGSRGNYVYIHHVINGQRYSTAYFHLASRGYVSIGQMVNTSTQLGTMGNTGNSTGAHLHFEVLVNWYGLTGYNTSYARNPRNYLSYPAVGVWWSGRSR